MVPDENPQTRTRTVRVVPELPAGLKEIANNQSGTLHLPANSQASAVTVHKDAILSRKGKTLVYLRREGKADIRPVRLGEASRRHGGQPHRIRRLGGCFGHRRAALSWNGRVARDGPGEAAEHPRQDRR